MFDIVRFVGCLWLSDEEGYDKAMVAMQRVFRRAAMRQRQSPGSICHDLREYCRAHGVNCDVLAELRIGGGCSIS